MILTRPARLGVTRLVAVDGPSGSGKTTFAAHLARAVADAAGGSVVTPARTIRTAASTKRSGLSTRPGRSTRPDPGAPTAGFTVAVVSTDLLATWEEPLSWWGVLEDNLLVPLGARHAARLPVVRWISGHPRPGGSIEVPVVDVLVLEGVSAGRAAVTDRLSALVWVEEPDPQRRLERAVARDGEPTRPFLVRWQVQEAAHFAADHTRERADLVVRPDRSRPDLSRRDRSRL